MKKLLLPFLFIAIVGTATAQKIDYKNNIISVDGKELAKVNRIKENFGLTSNFELFTLSGKKVIIATLATDFQLPNQSLDNSFYYYRFTFLTASQVAVFPLSKLGAEKSFTKLIGNANIFVNDELDEKLVMEFIATKSVNPKIAADYTTVSRDKVNIISIKEDKSIFQDGKLIGRFKDVTNRTDLDTYEFSLPNGLTIAKVSFAGGMNMQNMELYTVKDNSRRVVPMPGDKIFAASAPDGDRNERALIRILKWLISKDYI